MLNIHENNEDALSKFGVIGILWDQGDLNGRNGSRFAPPKVKACAERFIDRIEKDHIFDAETWKLVDLAQLSVKDYGNVKELPPMNWGSAYRIIEDKIGCIVKDGRYSFVIGGDCSLNYVATKALHDVVEGNVGVIYFDAHFDTREEDIRLGKYSHSSPLRNILDLERINPDNVVQIGVRGYVNPQFYQFVNETGYHVINNSQFFHMGIDRTVEEILKYVTKGTDKIVMCLDIDVMEGIFSPGSSCNEPAGPNSWEMQELVKKLAPFVDQVSLTEIIEMMDINDITCNEGAKIMWDYIINRYMADANR